MAVGLFDRHGEWLMRRFVRPGGIAIDVGAHMGYFALRLARLVGPFGAVHAFEPDPRLHPRLAEHVRVNDFPWANVNACGLFDREDEQTLTLLDQLGWSTVGDPVPEAECVAVPMTTLDRYTSEHDIDPARRLRRGGCDVQGARTLTAAIVRGTVRIVLPQVGDGDAFYATVTAARVGTHR